MFTEYCIPLAICNAGISAQWFLIDDYSQDETSDVLKKMGRRKDVAIKIGKKNRGMYVRHNEAIDYALSQRADFLAWIDNDLLLPPNWLRDLVMACISNEVDVGSAWPVNDKTATKMLTDSYGGLSRKLPMSSWIDTGVCGSTCTVTNEKALLTGVRYNENRKPWTYGDSRYHFDLANRGMKIGYFTGVKIWMLERLIWLDSEYEENKLALRHQHRKGDDESYSEELKRYKETLLGGGSVECLSDT
jgi:glycosyltransferase involved in cell wall biosynthesis